MHFTSPKMIPLQQQASDHEHAHALWINTHADHAELFDAAESRYDIVRAITGAFATTSTAPQDEFALSNLFHSLNVLMDEAARLHSAAYYAAVHHPHTRQDV